MRKATRNQIVALLLAVEFTALVAVFCVLDLPAAVIVALIRTCTPNPFRSWVRQLFSD